MYDAITDVPGVLVGHAQNYESMTGVTAILTEAGAVGGIDIRGTAAGTRQADSLSALHIAGVVHAVTLAGGVISIVFLGSWVMSVIRKAIRSGGGGDGNGGTA